MEKYVVLKDLIQARHGCKNNCGACDFAQDGDSWCQGELFVVDALRLAKCADDILTVRHGKWEKIDEYIDDAPKWECWRRCSVCKEDDAYAYILDTEKYEFVLQDNFCPNCGADMRGCSDGN